MAILLAGVNFVGIDPADVILLLTVPVLVLSRPSAIVLTRLAPICRVSIFGFFISYLVSTLLNDFNPSFVFNFSSNVLLFFIIYLSAASGSAPINLSRLILIGFFVPNAIYGALFFGQLTQPGFIFDIVRDTRYLGPMGDPNLEALHAIIVALILIDELVFSAKSLMWMGKLTLLLISMLILFSTQSRSAWLAFILCAPAYLLVSRRELKLVHATGVVMTIGLVVALGIGLLIPTEMIESRLKSVSMHESEAEEDRLSLIFTAAALAVGYENPLGVGPGMSISETGYLNLDGDPIGAHNAFVQILADNGWVALGSLLALIIPTLKMLYRQALFGLIFQGISTRVIFCGLVATCCVGMFHDLLSWRIAWIIPACAVLSVFLIKSRKHLSQRGLAC